MEMSEEKSEPRTFSGRYNHLDDISKADALKRCASFLGGSWTTLPEEDFELGVIKAGLNNRLFTCENKTPGEEPGVPKKVILRLYGGKGWVEADHVYRTGTIMDEVLVFQAMSERGLGPKLYGVFAEGRVEEYIPSRTISNEDFTSLDTMRILARKLARMHCVQVPLDKSPPSMFDKIEKILPGYLATERDELAALVPDPGQEENKAKVMVMALSIESELEWLKNVLPKIKTRQVLVHGDMNGRNCLFIPEAEDPMKRLILIDYEFSYYGYRGSDIHQQFHSRTVDSDKKNFKSGLEYPSLDSRRDFVRAYNDEMKNLGVYELDEDDLDNVENMIIEAEYFGLVMKVFWHIMIVRDRKKFESMDMKDIWNFFQFLAEQHDLYKESKEDVLAWFGECDIRCNSKPIFISFKGNVNSLN